MKSIFRKPGNSTIYKTGICESLPIKNSRQEHDQRATERLQAQTTKHGGTGTSSPAAYTVMTSTFIPTGQKFETPLFTQKYTHVRPLAATMHTRI
jgi:hypothetical protein